MLRIPHCLDYSFLLGRYFPADSSIEKKLVIYHLSKFPGLIKDSRNYVEKFAPSGKKMLDNPKRLRVYVSCYCGVVAQFTAICAYGLSYSLNRGPGAKHMIPNINFIY
jgi:hypothetical protein